jgi:hypothetical protein
MVEKDNTAFRILSGRRKRTREHYGNCSIASRKIQDSHSLVLLRGLFHKGNSGNNGTKRIHGAATPYPRAEDA